MPLLLILPLTPTMFIPATQKRIIHSPYTCLFQRRSRFCQTPGYGSTEPRRKKLVFANIELGPRLLGA